MKKPKPSNTVLVGVAQGAALHIHVVPDDAIGSKPEHRQYVIQGSRWSLAILTKPVVRVRPGAGILLLPNPPQPINLAMMQKEERILSWQPLSATNFSLRNRSGETHRWDWHHAIPYRPFHLPLPHAQRHAAGSPTLS